VGEGDECRFVGLGGRTVVEDGSAAVAACAVAALASEIEPPYRGIAVRRQGDEWSIGAVAIEVAALPADVEGEDLMLTLTEEGERELLVDGRSALAGLPALERLAGSRHEAYVLRAARLEGSLWEVTIDPL
jgi:hypothetical protein